MIKYIKERYSNPNQEQEQPTNHSTQNVRPPTEIQENYSTVALKGLKKTEDYIDSMKRRLSCLQIKDEKNTKRIEEGERKLNFHARVQQSVAR